MKYKDKFGNDIECTPQEYKELCGGMEQAPIEQRFNRRGLIRIDWDKKVEDAIKVINDNKLPLRTSSIIKQMQMTQGSSATKLRMLLLYNQNIKRIQRGGRIYFAKLDYKESSQSFSKPRSQSFIIKIEKEFQRIKAFINSQSEPLYFKKITDIMGIKYNVKLRDMLMNAPDIQKVMVGLGDGQRLFYKFARMDYKPISKKKNPNNVQRMTFMSQRANSLMKQDIHMTREKAYSIAGQEWSQKGRTLKVKVETNSSKHIIDEFPDLYHLEPLVLNKVKDIISGIISREGRIGYFDFKDICGWETAHHWVYFINHFMNKKKEIADFFSVPDKFSHKKIGDYDYILYGKGE